MLISSYLKAPGPWIVAAALASAAGCGAPKPSEPSSPIVSAESEAAQKARAEDEALRKERQQQEAKSRAKNKARGIPEEG